MQTSLPRSSLFSIYFVKRRSQSKLSFHQSYPSSIDLGFDNIINQTNKLNCTYITLYNYIIHYTIRTRDNKGIQGFYFGLSDYRTNTHKFLRMEQANCTHLNMLQ